MSERSHVAVPLDLSTLNSATLTASYQELNSTGFPGNLFWLRIENASTANITISYDGINDHEFLPATAAGIPRESLIIDFTGSPSSPGFVYLRKGTKVYVKGSAGVGNITMSGFYQDN